MCVCVCAGTYIIHYIFKMYILFYTHIYFIYILCENHKFCIGRYPVNTREKKNQYFKASELDCEGLIHNCENSLKNFGSVKRSFTGPK